VIFQSLGFVGTTWPNPANPQSIASPNSLVFDINDNGDAVGTFGADNTPTEHAFLLRGGSVIDLVPPLPQGSLARGINNNGLIVGSFLGNGVQGFIYDSVAQTAPIIINPLPGRDSSGASAVNKSGAVAGLSGSNNSHGYLFAGASLVDLGPAAFVEDINDSGVVAGSLGKPQPEFFHAAICDTSRANPSFSEIPLPPGFVGGHGNAINNNGDVVGTCWTQQTFDGDQTAYIFSGGVSTDLNTLIPANSGWRLQFANDINDAGQIAGRGLLNGQIRGFLLTPTSSFNLGALLAKLIELVGTIIGFQTVDGSGIIIVGGVPIPVGPWGPRVGDYAQKSDIVISLAVEEMATHIGNIEGQVAVRRAALEAARAQIGVLLEKLEQRR
jgi:probable HAF family extracellular repeat protein